MSVNTHPADGPPPRDISLATEEARSPPGQLRLLAAALPTWAATCWVILAPGRGAAVALAAGGAGTVLLLWWVVSQVRGRRRQAHFSSLGVSLLALLCAGLVLVGARVSIIELARSDSLLQNAALAGERVSFEARLTAFPEQRRTAFGTRNWVRIEALRPAGSVPTLLWLSEAAAVPGHWGPGTRLALEARVKTQPPSDAAAYTASPSSIHELGTEGTHTALRAKGALQALEERVGAGAARIRLLLVGQASQVSGAELVPGFAVGDTSLVDEHLHAIMLESSLTHLTAVSGSNTGLVIAAVIWCVGRLGGGRKTRIVAASCGLLAFVTIVGPDASVRRAAVMAAVLLIGSFGGRRAAALPALGFAVLALLALDPWQALQPGFALSVSATCGILLLASPLTRWLHRRVRLPKALALPLSVALAAQLSCGPLLLLLQPGLSAAGVLANLLAAPAAPLGTGLGLLAAVLGPIAPSAAALLVQAASLPATWIAATAEVCARLPGGRWNWPDGWSGALALAACELTLLLGWALSSGRIGLLGAGRAPTRQPWQARAQTPVPIRIVATGLVSGAIATILALTLVAPLATQLSTPKNWMVVACDVGQGDAILARDARRPEEVMLIDTGDDPQLLKRCLTRFGVTRIALLVLTHDDRDHVGALESVLQQVDAALISPTLHGESAHQRPIVRMLEQTGVPYRIGTAGDRRAGASGLRWEVLAPGSGTRPATSNSASLVLLLEVGDHRVLLLADTGYEEQAPLLRAAALARIDIVKVAHHGSRDQDPTLFDRIDADWGLISVGAENHYGHPNEETLGALARSGTRALRTDQHGSIALIPQHDGVLVPWFERAE